MGLRERAVLAAVSRVKHAVAVTADDEVFVGQGTAVARRLAIGFVRVKRSTRVGATSLHASATDGIRFSVDITETARPTSSEELDCLVTTRGEEAGRPDVGLHHFPRLDHYRERASLYRVWTVVWLSELVAALPASLPSGRTSVISLAIKQGGDAALSMPIDREVLLAQPDAVVLRPIPVSRDRDACGCRGNGACWLNLRYLRDAVEAFQRVARLQSVTRSEDIPLALGLPHDETRDAILITLAFGGAAAHVEGVMPMRYDYSPSTGARLTVQERRRREARINRWRAKLPMASVYAPAVSE